MPVTGITELIFRVLPADDSSLQWSGVSGGFTSNLEQTTLDLYARLVERYERPCEQPSRIADAIVQDRRVPAKT